MGQNSAKSLLGAMRLWAESLWCLFFPKRCIVCNRPLVGGERYLCIPCRADMPYSYQWCYKEGAAEESFSAKVPLERQYSLFFYRDNYKKIIYAIKYASSTRLARVMGRELGERIGGNSSIDYIVPVPLHWRRKLKRGYNQSQLIAEGILQGMSACSAAKLPCISSNALRRCRFTQTQTAKDKESRALNVQNAFALSGREYEGLYDAHILLVDDVLTTGATLQACALLLHSHYRCRISIATLAYDE